MIDGQLLVEETDQFGQNIHVDVTSCPRGNYCKNNVQTLCPAGTYGNTLGLSTPLCSGLCVAGFYCPEGTINYVLNRCGSVDKYCPQGSATPQTAPEGYYTTPETGNVMTRTGIEICPLGHYCTGGVKYECPAGSYGSSEGLTSSECSGLCEAGYYCPAGSTSSTANDCGSVDKYCPAGSGSPIDVPDGLCSYPFNVSEAIRYELYAPSFDELCIDGMYFVFIFVYIIDCIIAFYSRMMRVMCFVPVIPWTCLL